MIEKMSFVTLAGPKTEIDYLVDHYLSKHDIHLENALSELSSAEQFTTFTEENPFKAMLTKSRELMLLVKNPEKATISKINVNKAQKFIDKIDEQIDDIRTEVTNLEKQMDALNQDYAVLAPFKTLNYSLKGIYDMEFFKYRFGKIPRSEFDKFESYLDPDMDEIFLTCLVESEYVYGVFFAPIDKFNEVAKDFRNIHFDEIPIPKQYKGFPNDECLNIAKNKAELDEKIKSKNAEISTVVETNRDKLVSACRRIEIAFSNFDVRKLAAVTRDSGVTFQVLCGWMTTKEAKKLLKETDDDPNVVCIVSDDVDDHKSIPPTNSAPASLAASYLSSLQNTHTLTFLPVPLGRTTAPLTCWSACLESTPRRICASIVSSNLAFAFLQTKSRASAASYCFVLSTALALSIYFLPCFIINPPFKVVIPNSLNAYPVSGIFLPPF